MHWAPCAEQALLTESRSWLAVWSVPEQPLAQRQEELSVLSLELLQAAVAQPSERPAVEVVQLWAQLEARPSVQRDASARSLAEQVALSEAVQPSGEQLSVARAVSGEQPADEPLVRLQEARPLAELLEEPSEEPSAPPSSQVLLAQR